MENETPKSIEVEGATVEKAIEKAVKIFGVPKEDLVIKVVCEEKRGLFGMDGEKSAKIIATLKDKNSA